MGRLSSQLSLHNSTAAAQSTEAAAPLSLLQHMPIVQLHTPIALSEVHTWVSSAVLCIWTYTSYALLVAACCIHHFVCGFEQSWQPPMHSRTLTTRSPSWTLGPSTATLSRAVSVVRIPACGLVDISHGMQVHRGHARVSSPCLRTDGLLYPWSRLQLPPQN